MIRFQKAYDENNGTDQDPAQIYKDAISLDWQINN